MSKYRQKSSAEMGAQQAHENMEALQSEVDELQKELHDEANAITARWNSALQAYNEVPIRPNRNDIEVDLVALAWAPNWQIAYRDRQGIVRTEVLRAY
jgi:chemotaxis regulatin CheY-phosphate phosphatase CheZ